MKTLITAFLLIAAPVWALPVVKTVNCRMICLQTIQGAAPTLYAGSGEASVRCDLPQEEISKPVALPSVDGQIEFRAAPSDATPVVVATLPAAASGGLLLFLPTRGENAKSPYQILVLDDSARGLPENGSLVYNACPANLRFLMGEQQGTPKPGQVTAVGRPKKRDDFQMSGVVFQIQNGESWRTTYESMLRFPENQHRLFVAFVDPVSMLPSLRILRFSPR